MNRIGRLLCALVLMLASMVAFAQQRLSIKLSGYAGFGIDSRNQVTGFGPAGDPLSPESGSGSREMANDVSLNASGFVYHPQILLYDLMFNYSRNGTAINDRGMASNGLGGGGTLTFLSEREFATAIYFDRSNRDGGGSLQEPFSSHRDTLGLRGRLSFKGLPQVTYNVGKSNSDDNWDRFHFNARHKFANLTATRQWRGWDLILNEDYNRVLTDPEQAQTNVNSLAGNATRAFGHGIHLYLTARRLAYKFGRASGDASSATTVTAAFADMTWRHSPRWESHYVFDVSRNATNILALLAGATGVRNPDVSTQVVSLDSTLYSLQTGVTFRPTLGLSIGGRVRYHGQTLDSTGTSIDAATTTGELRTTAEAAYQRRLWKFQYQGSGLLEWQQFRFLLDGTHPGNSWRLSNGLSIGDGKRLRVRGTYFFTRRTLPVFLRLVNDREHRLTVGLETTRFGTRFTGEAEVGRGYQQWPTSTQDLNRTRYAVSATRGNLTFAATHATEGSNQLFFGPDSPLWQPGGWTGAVLIPPALFQSVMFARTKSDAFSAAWEPRRRFRLESRYLRFRYTLIDGEHQEEKNWQWDTNAQYEFGRFTFVGGYIRGSIGRRTYLQRENRYYFRVRFPFNIL